MRTYKLYKSGIIKFLLLYSTRVSSEDWFTSDSLGFIDWNTHSSKFQVISQNDSLQYQEFVDSIASNLGTKMEFYEKKLIGMEEAFKSAQFSTNKDSELVFECARLEPEYAAMDEYSNTVKKLKKIKILEK